MMYMALEPLVEKACALLARQGPFRVVRWKLNSAERAWLWDVTGQEGMFLGIPVAKQACTSTEEDT